MPSGADRSAAAAGATAHSGLASGKRPGSRVGPGWASARPWPRGCSSGEAMLLHAEAALLQIEALLLHLEVMLLQKEEIITNF